MESLFSLKALIHEITLYPSIFENDKQRISNLNIVLKFDEFPMLNLDL
jgi:hypothetical protein